MVAGRSLTLGNLHLPEWVVLKLQHKIRVLGEEGAYPQQCWFCAQNPLTPGRTWRTIWADGDPKGVGAYKANALWVELGRPQALPDQHSVPLILVPSPSLFHPLLPFLPTKIRDEWGNQIWICPGCNKPDDGSPMIGCDDCDDWYHW